MQSVLTSVWSGGFCFCGGKGCVPVLRLESFQGSVSGQAMQCLLQSGCCCTIQRQLHPQHPASLQQLRQELNLISLSLQVRKLIKSIRFSLLFGSWQTGFSFLLDPLVCVDFLSHRVLMPIRPSRHCAKNVSEETHE